MIQLNPTQLYLVQVPESATDFFTGSDEEGKTVLCYYVEFANNREFRFESIDFIAELIGTYQNGNIDFDAGDYVKNTDNDESIYSIPGSTDILFWDYIDNVYTGSSEYSFTSLLEANQVPIRDNEKYVVLNLK